MGKFDGKVVVITGGARGQGRADAVAFAREGAAVVVSDIGGDISSVPYALGGEVELKETVAMVHDAGGRGSYTLADIRSRRDMDALIAKAVDEFGQVDIVVANAGIASWHPFTELSEQAWRDVIDVNLTGTANTLAAVVPHMIERNYGRIVVKGSTLGRQGMANMAHYSAAKWGLHGLVKSVAMEVAPFGVTINIVNPTIVNTPMMTCDAVIRLFCPDIENPTIDDALPRYATLNKIPMQWMEPDEISKGVLFLASDDARYITGTALDLAAGANTTYTA
jgi:SDR family mycofactocin-dependent oxidoreductase